MKLICFSKAKGITQTIIHFIKMISHCMKSLFKVLFLSGTLITRGYTA